MSTMRLPRIGIRHALAIAAAIGLATAAAHQAAADLVRPDVPATITVGPSLGPCPMPRSDPQRTGRAQRLPDAPRELWHRKIRGGLSLPIAVDASGSFVIPAAVAEIVQVSPSGDEQWHHTLGMSVAATTPVILANGTRVVLTALGDAWGFGPDGSERFHVDLSRFGTDPHAAPLPRDNGNVIVANTVNLLELDSQGNVVDRVSLPERVVGSIIATPQGIVATTDAGRAFVWRQPQPPRLLGAFGGLVREGAALLAPRSLVAVVDNARLSSMDLSSGSVTTWLTLSGMDGPPAIGAHGAVFVAGSAGTLVGLTSSEEVLRASLNPAPAPDTDSDAGASPAALFASPSPPVIVDADNRIAFVRSDGRVGVVSPTGVAHAAATPACGSPLALVPAANGRFLVACRNGSIKLYGP